jgi:hypothetical protein
MDTTTTQPTRSALDVTALAATAVSAFGLLAGIVGRIAGAKGFSSNDKDYSAASDIFFALFVLGLLVSVVTGAAAWWTGRRHGRRAGVIAGWTALGYLLLAIVVAAVLNGS